MSARKLARKNLSILIMGLMAITFVSCSKKTDVKDNKIYTALRAKVKGLDPVGAFDAYSNAVKAQIYEGLFQYNYLKRPLELEPLLAASMPTVSNNGLTHTFKIKKGVMFQDDPAFPNGKGREVKAKDFVYSWLRLADPKNRSENFWIFDGKIKGLNEWRDKAGKGEANYETPIAGLQTPDDYTIVITLTQPYYQLYYVLATTLAVAVPQEAVAKYGEEFINHPVGTGPFAFKKWIRGSKIELVKNPTYHGSKYPTTGMPGDKEAGFLADAGKTLPLSDGITYFITTESQPYWLKFMKGEVDASGIPKDNFEGAIQGGGVAGDLKKKGIQLLVVSEPDVTYIAFNMLDPILGKSDKVRKAISLAYDTETSIERFYNNRAVKAHSPIPPDIEGYDAGFKNPNKEHNIEKAKKLLADAGYPGGKGLPTFEYSATESSVSRQMAEYFQQQMGNIGLQIKIASNSWPQFTSKIRDKKAQMWGVAWIGDYPDAENFLQLLYGKNASPGPNGANFNNSKYNELYKKAAKLPPGAARTKLYHEMRDIFVNEMPWVPGVHRLGYYLRHGWVHNYKRHLTIDNYYKYLRIDPKQRAKMRAKL